MMNLPYSQCDAKGRCMRHPTIQMSRKKKLGGWKKLTDICTMCAMEIIANGSSGDGQCDAATHCGDVAVASPAMNGPPASSRGHDANSSNTHRSRPHSGHHNHQDSDDRSIDAKSVRSAPSTFHRRDSSESGHSKRSTNSSDSSCDTTVDMMSHSSSSEHSSPRSNASGNHGFRRSNSNGGGSVYSQNSQRSARSQNSQHSARSQNSSHSQGHHSVRSSGSNHSNNSRSSSSRRSPAHPPRKNANTIIPNQEQFVCGMEYQGMFYTGQIHVDSRLPHGLGTLRNGGNGNMSEGQWQFGRLVQESNPRVTAVPTQEYQEKPAEEYACKNYDDYCIPCTSSNSPTSAPVQNKGSDNHYQESLCDNFQQCHIVESSDGSIAETINDNGSDNDTRSTSSSSWSRSSSCASNISSYSARESKTSLPPPPPPTNSRVTYNKLQEYQQYVQQCDEEEDWYQDDVNQSSSRTNGRGNSNSYYSPQCVGGMERPKKVRFSEDP